MSITPATDRDPITTQAFAKVDTDLRYLVDRLAEVLTAAGDGDLVPYLPWRGGDLPTSLSGENTDNRVCQVLSICFQLLNAVEENSAMQARRTRENESGYLAEKGLWGKRLQRRLETGWTQDQILAAVRSSRVEPVFTAHPTEAKRHDILHLHRELYLLLVNRENTMWTETEQVDLDDEVRSVLERLWRTGEVHFTRPTVAEERDGIIHYLGDVLPEVIPLVDKRFRHAWHEAGLDPTLVSEVDALPQFGSWVGGDRDGHPGVNAETTRATLHALRRGAL